MGRLFWKFFFFIWLAQLAGIVAMGGSFWLKSHNQSEQAAGIDRSPPASMLIDSAVLTLKHGGVDALRGLMGEMSRHKVYAIDEAGKEILDRSVDSLPLDQARNQLSEEKSSANVRQVAAEDGHTYLFFVPADPNRPYLGPPHPNQGPPPRDGFIFPLFPTMATLMASLIAAVMLARHFSKPIRSLRTAFEAATSGNLHMRLTPVMGNRRDELADLGRDFDRMTDQLRILMESQRRLLHDVSHEMRSPLARLQVAVGLARQQPDKMDSWIGRIERESIRIDQLVGELLTISRLEAGVMGSMEEKINVGELMNHIVADAQFESTAQKKRIVLAWEDTAIVKGQAELLHRAIENVIRNAVKHTAEGSSVEVQGKISADSKDLLLTVCDHGSGVADAELGFIFDPFFRSASSRGDLEGHGLGLAIAKRVVEAHRGTITAFNLERKGLCVQIVLPLEKGLTESSIHRPAAG